VFVLTGMLHQQVPKVYKATLNANEIDFQMIYDQFI